MGYINREKKAKHNAKILGAAQIVEKVINSSSLSWQHLQPVSEICKVCHPLSPHHLVSLS
jgi:hypothetical protein